MTRAAICAGLVAIAVPAPVRAQSQQRLERIEAQINALQRAVFPGGDDRFFEPEITPQSSPSQPSTPQVSTSALTDVLARLDAIETQLARLTAATEVNENALAAVEMRLDTLEGQGTVRSGSTASNSGPSGVIPIPDDDEPLGFAEEDEERELPATTETTAGNSAQSGPSPARLEAVQAIAKPATGDAGDDEYVYGFRLWDAGFYPEAQQQLSLFVERYPDHWRTTYGRNLLGRAFLDAGNARAAATHFFDNYQDDSTAARAPDSLLYLAESMIELGDTRRACIAIAEFGDTYPALATGRLADQYGSLSGRVDCE
ncbi:tetratricopeptide repeat protein [Aurantiacibacter poecillastricola]|uniref:tetratricopeptide repeat protein n=1 Tax=Aurantiacibacter poecillastricola TaxID=3064385 RepID=UPI00273D3623|nr:tetratricopeptide repeat protein [Aurantiacibacter sp. 219JJ12-13]MDP5261215.1 hypothetical protein [Aurantiacibacter sp. 219JJ12-13]